MSFERHLIQCIQPCLNLQSPRWNSIGLNVLSTGQSQDQVGLPVLSLSER